MTTDGLNTYPDSVEYSFGSRVDYAQLVKEFGAEGGEEQRRYAPPRLIGAKSCVSQVLRRPNDTRESHVPTVRASAIVREVRETQSTYIVTVRGEPVAELRPLAAKSLDERRQAEIDEAMLRMEELAQHIAHAWTSPRGAVELVQEQRR